MSGSKTNKLRGAWTETKIEMLMWIQKTISMMESGNSAKDVLAMVDAAGKLIKMLGDISPEDQTEGLESKDLTMATERIRRSMKRFKDGTMDIFGDSDEDDGDDEDDA